MKARGAQRSLFDSLGQRDVLELAHLTFLRWKLFPRRLQIELSELLRQLDRLVDYPLQLIVVAQLLVAWRREKRNAVNSMNLLLLDRPVRTLCLSLCISKDRLVSRRLSVNKRPYP